MKTYQQALVLGFGKSGEAAARLLMGEGTAVTVVDAHTSLEHEQRAEPMRAAGANILLHKQIPPDVPFDVCVISPGIPITSSWATTCRQRSIPIISELELGWSRFSGKTIAVTGTNGKSTIVKLLADMLCQSGVNAVACGNYGYPVSAVVNDTDVDCLVMEVSTFQLESVHTFRADINVLLNIHPDHLDRHADFKEYVSLKVALFEHIHASDISIVPYEWKSRIPSSIQAHGIWITFGIEEDADYRYENSVIMAPDSTRISLADSYFNNPILGVNAAAACAVALTYALPPQNIEKGLQAFRPLPHRMEVVGIQEGVTYINDSKSTTLTSVKAALEMISGPVRLIAGGILKEKDVSFLKEVLAQRVEAVYLIGEAAEKLKGAWGQVVPCVCCNTLEEAVMCAGKDTRQGEVVLLSPGCASFDQFNNYQHRGNRFKNSVTELEKEKQACRPFLR